MIPHRLQDLSHGVEEKKKRPHERHFRIQNFPDTFMQVLVQSIAALKSASLATRALRVGPGALIKYAPLESFTHSFERYTEKHL
jgi:hypothetical protein